MPAGSFIGNPARITWRSSAADHNPTPVAILENVSKIYGCKTALADLSMAIWSGQLTALLGPNGAGKTTALSLILGLRKPTRGRVLVFGQHPSHRAVREKLGVMLQVSGVPDNLRVKEVVELFRRIYKEKTTAAETIERACLVGHEHQMVAHLSGGQRQRLYFAIALIGRPSLLLLDEPTLGLDADVRRHFWQAIKDYRLAGGTVVLTTHYLEEADTLAERVVIIDHGTVVADASPRELKALYAAKTLTFSSSLLSESQLHALPDVKSVTRVRDKWQVVTTAPEHTLQQLLNSNLIADLEVHDIALEDAFLQILTGNIPATGQLRTQENMQ